MDTLEVTLRESSFFWRENAEPRYGRKTQNYSHQEEGLYDRSLKYSSECQNHQNHHRPENYL